MYSIDGHLTEDKLGKFLEHMYGVEFIRDKRFSKEIAFRPDFVNHDMKLVVEFNGHTHYTKYSTIVRDRNKKEVFNSRGYNVVEIPYFIQLDNVTSLVLFGRSFDVKTDYQHGFVDKKALRICDFNILGVSRFMGDVTRFFSTILSTDFTYGMSDECISDNNLTCVVRNYFEGYAESTYPNHNEIQLKIKNILGKKFDSVMLDVFMFCVYERGEQADTALVQFAELYSQSITETIHNVVYNHVVPA